MTVRGAAGRRPGVATPKGPATPAGPELTAQDVAYVRGLVIYEDAEVIVFDKPAGLSSQGGRGQVKTLDVLLGAFAKSNGKRPRLVHRLDRDTSGVLLTARTKPAAAFLGRALMARRFVKTYHALVAAGPSIPARGVIDVPLRREDSGREAYMRVCKTDHPDAEIAVTRYQVLADGEGAWLLEATPETGRMHQIRVHLAHLGHPVLGDTRYGGPLVLAGRPVARHMLHARALVFPHPAGGAKAVQSPWPADFAAVALGAWIAPPDEVDYDACTP